MPNDDKPLVNSEELAPADALAELKIEDAWALDLLEDDDRQALCQSLIMESVHNPTPLG